MELESNPRPLTPTRFFPIWFLSIFFEFAHRQQNSSSMTSAHFETQGQRILLSITYSLSLSLTLFLSLSLFLPLLLSFSLSVAPDRNSEHTNMKTTYKLHVNTTVPYSIPPEAIYARFSKTPALLRRGRASSSSSLRARARDGTKNLGR